MKYKAAITISIAAMVAIAFVACSAGVEVALDETGNALGAATARKDAEWNLHLVPLKCLEIAEPHIAG